MSQRLAEAFERAFERDFRKALTESMSSTTENAHSDNVLTLDEMQASINALMEAPPLPPLPSFVVVKRDTPGYAAIPQGGVLTVTELLHSGAEVIVAYVREDDVYEVINAFNGDEPK